MAVETSLATAAYDMTDSNTSRVTRLESDVSHIRTDISDIKIDLRQMREELSTHRSETYASFQALDARLASNQTEMHGEFKAVRAEMQDGFKAVRAEMQDGFKAVRAEMHGEIKTLRTETQTGFSELRTEIAALAPRMLKREWAMLSLMVTLFLALLGVMLRGFGWIG